MAYTTTSYGNVLCTTWQKSFQYETSYEKSYLCGRSKCITTKVAKMNFNHHDGLSDPMEYVQNTRFILPMCLHYRFPPIIPLGLRPLILLWQYPLHMFVDECGFNISSTIILHIQVFSNLLFLEVRPFLPLSLLPFL